MHLFEHRTVKESKLYESLLHHDCDSSTFITPPGAPCKDALPRGEWHPVGTYRDNPSSQAHDCMEPVEQVPAQNCGCLRCCCLPCMFCYGTCHLCCCCCFVEPLRPTWGCPFSFSVAALKSIAANVVRHTYTIRWITDTAFPTIILPAGP